MRKGFPVWVPTEIHGVNCPYSLIFPAPFSRPGQANRRIVPAVRWVGARCGAGPGEYSLYLPWVSGNADARRQRHLRS